MHTLGKVKNLALAFGDCAEPTARIRGEGEVVAAADRLVANTAEEARQLIDLYGADPWRGGTGNPGGDPSGFRAAWPFSSRAPLWVSAGGRAGGAGGSGVRRAGGGGGGGGVADRRAGRLLRGAGGRARSRGMGAGAVGPALFAGAARGAVAQGAGARGGVQLARDGGAARRGVYRGDERGR